MSLDSLCRCFLTCICLWQISQIQTRLFKVVGPGLVSTSPAFVSSSASHPVGPHGRHAQKTVKRAPIAGGGKVRHKLHYESSTACWLCRLEPGEDGRLPLRVTIDKRLMSFWLRLLNKEESSLAHIVYMIAHTLFVRDVYTAKWLCRVKNIVDNYGLSYLWLNQSMIILIRPNS